MHILFILLFYVNMCLFCVLLIFTMKPVARKHLTNLKVAALFWETCQKAFPVLPAATVFSACIIQNQHSDCR